MRFDARAHQRCASCFPFARSHFFTEPMRTPKRLKIAETRSRLIAVDWESLGYNITRCHTFNVTICYHYMTANNHSKADCLDMDPKGKYTPLMLIYSFTINRLINVGNMSGHYIYFRMYRMCNPHEISRHIWLYVRTCM